MEPPQIELDVGKYWPTPQNWTIMPNIMNLCS